MNLGKISAGNKTDVINAIKQGKKVCAVYDRESSADVRNLLFYPSEEEKETLALLGKNIGIMEFPKKTYSEALLIYAAYDDKESLPTCITERINDDPCFFYCSQDMLTQPVKYLAWLQTFFDEVYLL